MHLLQWLRAEGRLARISVFALAACGLIGLANAVSPALGLKPVRIGRPLFGVTANETMPSLTFDNLRNKTWQKAVAQMAAGAVPLRPLLVRLNNEVSYALFGESAIPYLLIGRHRSIVEKQYLDEYCSRSIAGFRPVAEKWIEDLAKIQDWYEAQGRHFLYVITPSKVAQMPDEFVDRARCRGLADAPRFLEAYDRMLRARGIHVANTAMRLLRESAASDLPLWPVAGVHWTLLGAAHATQEVAEAWNAAIRQRVFPSLRWKTELLARAIGRDRDQFGLLNLLRGSWPGVGVGISLEPTPCPARIPQVTIVGGSFANFLAEMLEQTGCVDRILHYVYLYVILGEYPARSDPKQALTPQDVAGIAEDAWVMLEENEALIARSNHGRAFRDLVFGAMARSGRERTAP